MRARMRLPAAAAGRPSVAKCRGRERQVPAVGERVGAFGLFNGGEGDAVVAVSRPCLAGMRDPAPGGDERLDVDRPTVLLAWFGERLVVSWDQCPAELEHVVGLVSAWLEQAGDFRHAVLSAGRVTGTRNVGAARDTSLVTTGLPYASRLLLPARAGSRGR